MEIIIIILIIILLIYSIFSTIGIIRASKKVELYEEYIKEIKKNIMDAYLNMKQIDTIGAFEADDDVGATFSILYDIIKKLNSEITETPEEYYDEKEKRENRNIK